MNICGDNPNLAKIGKIMYTFKYVLLLPATWSRSVVLIRACFLLFRGNAYLLNIYIVDSDVTSSAVQREVIVAI